MSPKPKNPAAKASDLDRESKASYAWHEWKWAQGLDAHNTSTVTMNNMSWAFRNGFEAGKKAKRLLRGAKP